jgi:hypothetical protein
MRSKRRLVLSAFLLAFAVVIPTLAGTVVERTLAFVNRRPILLSEVQLTRALLGLDEKEALERTIDEVMMFEEASRLLSDAPPPDNLAAAMATLREIAGPEFPEAALKRKALAQIAIASYIDVRLRPLIRVDDAEVTKIFNERLAKEVPPPSFTVASVEIRELLQRRALDQRIEEWVTSLRRREEVRRPPAR